MAAGLLEFGGFFMVFFMKNISSVGRLRQVVNVTAVMIMITLVLLILITGWGAYQSFLHAKNLPTHYGKVLFVLVAFGPKLWLQIIGLMLLYIVQKCLHLFCDISEAMADMQRERQG